MASWIKGKVDGAKKVVTDKVDDAKEAIAIKQAELEEKERVRKRLKWEKEREEAERQRRRGHGDDGSSLPPVQTDFLFGAGRFCLGKNPSHRRSHFLCQLRPDIKIGLRTDKG